MNTSYTHNLEVFINIMYSPKIYNFFALFFHSFFKYNYPMRQKYILLISNVVEYLYYNYFFNFKSTYSIQ